jgi:hypothetical protein
MKIISDEEFKNIIESTWKVTTEKKFGPEHYFSLLEKAIDKVLQKENRRLMDFELVQRSDEKFNVILTLDKDEEVMYSIKLDDKF